MHRNGEASQTRLPSGMQCLAHQRWHFSTIAENVSKNSWLLNACLPTATNLTWRQNGVCAWRSCLTLLCCSATVCACFSSLILVCSKISASGLTADLYSLGLSHTALAWPYNSPSDCLCSRLADRCFLLDKKQFRLGPIMNVDVAEMWIKKSKHSTCLKTEQLAFAPWW